uniref:Uncharacterized protein n=1 Tax=Thermodesulfovibrio aggregans TaxID=86166 RepID=A0A7C4AK88_9BACT
MPKKEKQEKIQEESIQEEKIQEDAVVTQEKKVPLRYVGKTINHFKHDGVLYQLIPNTVYVNLPDCEQVRFLIKNKELVEV